jgi:hypothetical protein
MSVTRHRGLAEPAADAAIDAACRNLRLPTMRGQFSELADAAARDQMTYRGFLAELRMAECDDRNRRLSERQIKAAGFPREKALRTFEFEANPAIDPAAIHTLASCDWGREPGQWIERVQADDVPAPHGFVTGIGQDLDAVVAGLSLRHSSGEGHNNKIKMVKRQMFGRADLDLLRKRILLAA